MNMKEFETYYQEHTPVDEKGNHASKVKCREMIDPFVAAVTDMLADGESVRIKGFGIFGVRERAAKDGVNPKTLERIKIPAGKSPYFKPSSMLKNVVNGK